MSRLAALLVFCLALAQLRAASPVLTLKNELIPSPAAVGSSALRFQDRTFLWKTPSKDFGAAKFNAASRSWENIASPGAAGQKPTRPTVVQNAGRIAKAWFDPAPKDPSIQLSIKPASNENFLMPVRIEDGHPTGDPDLVLLADGTVFVSWPEHYNQNETALWLRRISPGGTLSVPALLAVIPTSQLGQCLTLLKDFDDKPAQLLLAYTIGQGETAQIATRLLTIDPATDDIRRSPCHNCPTTDDVARGYALRGQVVSFSAEHSTLTLQHNEIVGVLPVGKTTFKVDPAILKSAAPGNELFAHVEKRGNDWWLFNASWVVRAQP